MREVCLDAALLIEFLEVERPEICMTYGGRRFVRLAAIETRKRGIKNVFFLHNLSYGDASLFACFDAVVIPSEFARRYYKERLGIDSSFDLRTNATYWASVVQIGHRIGVRDAGRIFRVEVDLSYLYSPEEGIGIDNTNMIVQGLLNAYR